MLSVVIGRFPGHRQAILALSLSDRLFRSLIEDLVLAHETLERFEARSDADERPEVPEYRAIIEELDAEVRTYLALNGAPPG
jgi:hypothetical protein